MRVSLCLIRREGARRRRRRRRRALSSLGKGFDLSSDFCLKYCKGDHNLIVLKESDTRDLWLPGFGIFARVSVDVKCDKGERTRYQTDILDFKQMSEFFNQKTSVPGKIPSGLFNSMFGFQSESWSLKVFLTSTDQSIMTKEISLLQVNEGKIPENRLALQLLAEEILQWPNLEANAVAYDEGCEVDLKNKSFLFDAISDLPQGLTHFSKILEVADDIILSRGNLGIDLPPVKMSCL